MGGPKPVDGDARLQTDWLRRARGKPVRVKLIDGSQVSGILAGSDRYCVALTVAAIPDAVLIYKSGVAAISYLATGEKKPPS